MTTSDQTPTDTHNDDPKHRDPSARPTEHRSEASDRSKNPKVYEWAAKWGLKPRQVITTARRLNLRVQNRLTRLPAVDAERILAEIKNPQTESEPS